jgi:hypothetical protein
LTRRFVVAHVQEALREAAVRCSTCHDACAAAIVYSLNQRGDHAGADHIRSLVECAQACELARDLLLDGSTLYHDACRVCAEVCERCAEACEALGEDEVLRRCAEECRRCAASCRETASHGSHGDV